MAQYHIDIDAIRRELQAQPEQAEAFGPAPGHGMQADIRLAGFDDARIGRFALWDRADHQTGESPHSVRNNAVVGSDVTNRSDSRRSRSSFRPPERLLENS